MRKLWIGLLAVVLSTPASRAFTNQECNETEIGAYLCGDDCYIYRENYNCITYTFYVQCWVEDDPETGDGHWEQSYDCEDRPCFI